MSLDVDLVAAQAVIELFTAHRLLTVDRDFVTESPTVEVAHEALLTEWGRLRDWIEESREDVKRHAALTAAMNEWIEAGRHPDFLLTGSRLEGYQQWVTKAAMHLTTHQQRYLDTAVEARTHARRLEDERSAQEQKTQRAARRRLWGLVTAVLLVVGLAVSASSSWCTSPSRCEWRSSLRAPRPEGVRSCSPRVSIVLNVSSA